MKLDNVDRELRTALETIRSARTPLQKQQAKQKATNILKKKKMYEAHFNNMSSTQMNVENAHIQTQMMRDNMDIMNTLKGTVQVQKDMMQGMNPDEIYNLMDDMKEIQEDQNELNEAFTRNYEVDIGDEELDAGKLIFFYLILELDELDYQMKVELDSNELSVPKNRIVSKKEKDEKELNEFI